MGESSADTLRRAAKVLREHAEAAPHGPWSWEGGYPQRVTNGAATLIADIFENPDMRSTIAEYVALMDPTVGLALADWLDVVAGQCAFADRVVQSGLGQRNETADEMAALAVARAVLREPADE